MFFISSTNVDTFFELQMGSGKIYYFCAWNNIEERVPSNSPIKME